LNNISIKVDLGFYKSGQDVKAASRFATTRVLLYRLSLRSQNAFPTTFYTSIFKIFYKRNIFGGQVAMTLTDAIYFTSGKTTWNSLATWYCALWKAAVDIVLYSNVVRRVRGQTITSTVWFIIAGELIVLTRITFRRTARNGLRLITGLGFYPRRSWI